MLFESAKIINLYANCPIKTGMGYHSPFYYTIFPLKVTIYAQILMTKTKKFVIWYNNIELYPEYFSLKELHPMQNCLRMTLVLLTVAFFACSQKDNGAKLRLDAARSFYAQKEYESAKQEIDSINILYPKAIEERKASLLLLDSVRRTQNLQVIAECDSLIAINSPEVDKVKSLFSYQRNKQYQETGAYIPKESLSGGRIVGTTLRSGVGEDGVLYIESVFVGGKQKHNQIKISKKDGSFVQSQPVTDEGLNYRFSDMGKEYEVIRFMGSKENGVAKFVFANEKEPLTVTLEGRSKYSYTLSQTIKTAISKSFQLSTMMLQLDSLKNAKEKAEFNIYNLDKKEGKVEDVAIN